jgi:hypothetical protein
MWKRRSVRTVDPGRAAVGFCDWVASLPYVTQREHGFSPTVSVFDIDCDPLERRIAWLMVDHIGERACTPTRISALLPRRIARAAEQSGLGVCTAPRLPDHVLFNIDPLAQQRDVESLVLAAYSAAMS